MTELGVLVTFVLVALLFASIVISAILAYLYYTRRSQASQIEAGLVAWRERELDAIRKEQTELAQGQASASFEQWRNNELDSIRKQQTELAQAQASVSLEQWKDEYTQTIRQDAIQKSQSVTLGKITEHFIPYLPDFTYNPKDARFLGSPVDFVVFDGLNDGEVRNIVFVEVKTGASGLNTRERRIREAVQSGKVEWIELHHQFEVTQISEAIQTMPT